VLLVASRYPNQPKPLWNLPGGRQNDGELLEQTLVREFLEEIGLHIRVGPLLYVSESYDADTHFSNFTFQVGGNGELLVPSNDAHVVDAAWVPFQEIGTRITVAIVREPLVKHLQGSPQRYFAYADAGISIEFAD